MDDKKVDNARALVAGEWRISLASCCIRVSRAILWPAGRRTGRIVRRKRRPDYTEALERIHTVIGNRPPMVIVGMSSAVRSTIQKLMALRGLQYQPRITLMHQNALLPERKPPSKLSMQGKWSLEKVTSYSALTESGSVVITVKNCGSLYWAASTGGYDSESAQDVMPDVVKRHFGNSPSAYPLSC